MSYFQNFILLYIYIYNKKHDIIFFTLFYYIIICDIIIEWRKQ